jgi:hypothetical protein
MDRPFNMFVPIACPRCLVELFPTLDDIEQERIVLCPRCGTEIELRPDDLPTPGPLDMDMDEHLSM